MGLFDIFKKKDKVIKGNDSTMMVLENFSSFTLENAILFAMAKLWEK